MRSMDKTDLAEIERLIDGLGLKELLNAIARVVRFKAKCVQGCCHNENLSDAWTDDAESIEEIARDIRN